MNEEISTTQAKGAKVVKGDRLTRNQQRDYAQHLYLTDSDLSLLDIAKKVGVSEQTLSKWKRDGKWEELRVSLLTSKDAQLARLYRQMDNINKAIESREEDERYANTKECDIMVKLTSAIRNLEAEANISDKLAVGKEFLTYARRTSDSSIVKEIASIFDSYIKSML